MPSRQLKYYKRGIYRYFIFYDVLHGYLVERFNISSGRTITIAKPTGGTYFKSRYLAKKALDRILKEYGK